ncbi:MAG: hypothetical protein WBG46_12255 [Nonlabens sp.]
MKKLFVLFVLLFGLISNAQFNDFQLTSKSDFTQIQMDSLAEKGRLNFHVYGIAPPNSDLVAAFKAKYNVGYFSKGCIITNSTATDIHNRFIVQYLSKKHGEDWRDDLKIHPFLIAKEND